jgi:hypothetical protein
MPEEKDKTVSNNEANDTNSGRAKISERKRAANQANGSKSKGPRTQRGKSFSRLNGLKHGLLAKTLLFNASGNAMEPELLAFHNDLVEEYGSDLRSLLEIDVAVAEYWRLKQAIAMEVAGKRLSDHFLMSDWIPQVQRYATAAKNSLMKALDSLGESKEARTESAEAGDDEPDSDVAEDDSPADVPERMAANFLSPASNSEIPEPSVAETDVDASPYPTPPNGAGPNETLGAMETPDRDDAPQLGPSVVQSDAAEQPTQIKQGRRGRPRKLKPSVELTDAGHAIVPPTTDSYERHRSE